MNEQMWGKLYLGALAEFELLGGEKILAAIVDAAKTEYVRPDLMLQLADYFKGVPKREFVARW